MKLLLYLSIAGAGQHCREALGVLGHAVHPISVSVQGGHEGLGKHPLQFGGIQSTLVFSGYLERVEGWVVISRNCTKTKQ